MPPGRSFGALVYDSQRQRSILFGGGSADSDAQRFDTWRWDGRSWQVEHPAAYPSTPLQAATYSSLFSAVVILADQGWTWSGSTWSPIGGDLPNGSTQFALADDPVHHDLVLFGSFSRSGSLTYETWTLDGGTWHQRHPAHPPAGGPAYETYDPANGGVVLFDGATYTWDGRDWTQHLSATTPHARLFASMAFDSAIGRTVLFGGKSVYRDPAGVYAESINNELWTWDGIDWHLEP